MKHASRMLTLSVAGVIALSLGACTNGIHDQVVGGSALLGEPKVGALSTTASYRSVVAKFDGEQGTKVCPEPPPDVAVAVTSAMTAGLTIESDKLGTEGNAGLSRAIAESLTPMLRRTAAIQFYRDARSYNCFAHMNGALTDAQYNNANAQALTAAKEVMLKEVEKGFAPIDPEQLKTRLDTVIKDLNEIKKQVGENKKPGT